MAGGVITPEQWFNQWALGGHQLEVNVHNFTVKAYQLSIEEFQDSFKKKSFDGKSWPHWQGGYSGQGGLMDETGLLKNSIKLLEHKNNVAVIHTDPDDFAAARRQKGKVTCYAEVHNNWNTIKKKPPRGPLAERQFMGESEKLDQKVAKYYKDIFKGYPK